MLKNLLLYRFGIFNGLATALFGYLASKGYVAMAVAGDPSGITLVITCLFLILGGSTLWRTWKTAKELNALKEGRTIRQQGMKRVHKIKHIHDGANWLAYLGLIGTIVGFIIALSGIDMGALSTAQGVQNMVPTLMAGMSVALYTTLAGAFFGLWTEVNYRMLETAALNLVEDEKDQS